MNGVDAMILYDPYVSPSLYSFYFFNLSVLFYLRL